MTVPIIDQITPSSGPTSGGDTVRIVGRNFSSQVQVLFGGIAGEILFVNLESESQVVDVRTPPHEPGYVDVEIINLDESGALVSGEEAKSSESYRYVREEIVKESLLTRLIRRLLRNLKKQLLLNTSLTVSLNYDDTFLDGMNIIAMAELPSVVLSGPRVRENKFYSTCEAQQTLVDGELGLEVIRHRPPFTVDLEFTLTVASNSTVELLNLMAATATFLNRNRWLELPRDPANLLVDIIRWEMDPAG